MLLLLQCQLSLAATWVVANDGTGDYENVSDALWAASPYDTVLVTPGVYSPSTGEDLPWYFANGVTIEGAGADTTVLDAEGKGSFATVVTQEVRLSGVTLQGATNTALVVSSNASLHLDNCAFVGNQGSFVGALQADTYSDGVLVEECVFLDNEVTDPSGVTATYGPVEVQRSEFADQPSDTQYTLHLTGQTPFNVDAITVQGGVVRIDADITNSVFLGLSSGNSLDVCLYSHSWVVENSTILGCSGPVAVLAGVARNNIVAYNSGAGIETGYAVANLTWSNSSGDWQGTDWTDTLGNLAVEPMFRDFTHDDDWSDDLRLSTGSPAIDAAAPDYPPYDHDSIPRPQDGNGDGVFRADIGAYEWGMIDQDGDGWYLDGGDCDDTDPDVHPFAEEIPYDGIDQDCDGSDLVDVDGDGFDADHQGGDDCDDTDAEVHPGAWDIPNNGIDEDCDGQDAVDTDGDGWPDDQDCDPDDPMVHPGAEEQCNGIDDDCDGEVDEGDVCDPLEPGVELLGGCSCGGCRGGASDTGGSTWLLLIAPGLLLRRRSNYVGSDPPKQPQR